MLTFSKFHCLSSVATQVETICTRSVKVQTVKHKSVVKGVSTGELVAKFESHVLACMLI